MQYTASLGKNSSRTYTSAGFSRGEEIEVSIRYVERGEQKKGAIGVAGRKDRELEDGTAKREGGREEREKERGLK